MLATSRPPDYVATLARCDAESILSLTDNVPFPPEEATTVIRSSLLRTIRRWTSRIAIAALSISWASTIGATTVFLHQGALNPIADEGWSNITSANASTTAGPVFNDLGSGYDAWSVDDNSTALDTVRMYYEDLTAAQVAEGTTAGWRLTARLRIVNLSDGFATVAGFGLSSAVSVFYRDAVHDWYLGFGSQADGDPILRLPNNNGAGALIALEGAGSGYHLYELVYDPLALSADLFVDGLEVASNLVGNSTTGGQRRVAWGASTSPDAGQGNYNLVRFATSNAAYVVPVPMPAVLLASALVPLLRLRRRPSPP